MLHGDLANSIGKTVAFRCEDSLIVYKENGVKDKVLNYVFGKIKRAELNEQYLKAMEYVYRQTEYVVDLVVETKNYTEEFKDLLKNIPYSRIVLIDEGKESQISSRLLTGDITIYVDENADRRSLVNSHYAIPIHKLKEYIKG